MKSLSMSKTGTRTPRTADALFDRRMGTGESQTSFFCPHSVVDDFRSVAVGWPSADRMLAGRFGVERFQKPIFYPSFFYQPAWRRSSDWLTANGDKKESFAVSSLPRLLLILLSIISDLSWGWTLQTFTTALMTPLEGLSQASICSGSASNSQRWEIHGRVSI
jgi:hypothetical protein